jgi:ABC-type lipoprotein release transport system permease subunit
MVDMLPLDMAGMGLVMFALSLAAAIIPARQAARQNVVAALGHV